VAFTTAIILRQRINRKELQIMMETHSKDKIGLAWAALKYEGGGPPLSAIFTRLDNSKYRKICIYLKQGCEEPNPLEKEGIKIYYLSKLQSFKIFNFAAVFKMAKILRKEQIKILHCHRHQAAVYGIIAAKLAGIKVVFTHVHGLNRSKNPRRKFINRLVLPWAAKILAVSKAVKADILSHNRFLHPDKIICLNNSIDFARFAEISITQQQAKQALGLNQNDFVFGTVGRLAPTKGLEYLLRAFAIVHTQVLNSKLIIAGTGRLKQQLVQLTKELNIEKYVSFLGYRTDIETVMRAMDVFVLASIAEGMPGAVLEAMAAGVPVAATSAGGTAEILENGKYGIMVPPADADALAEGMLKAVKMPQETKTQIIEAARAKVKAQHDFSVITKQLENIYEQEYKTAMHAF